MLKKLGTSCFCYLGLIALTLWIIGFGIFCLYALSLKFHPAEKAEAIVVLTGGNERIPKGLNLFHNQYAQYMLISGVNQDVADLDILGQLPQEFRNKVELGRKAKDTRGNALEVAAFIKSKQIKTVLLITSFYHMPRSVFEVSQKSPNVRMIPYPVFPKRFGQSVDWIRTRYAWLLFVEYHKFMATVTQNFFERIF